MRYYVNDPTIGRYAHFDSVQEVVSYLENMLQRAHNISRKDYMENLISLGYGYDDPAGAYFTRSMRENFDIGVIRDGRYVKTDIHNTENFNKPEFGD